MCEEIADELRAAETSQTRTAGAALGRRGLLLGAGAAGLGVVGALLPQVAQAATSQNGWGVITSSSSSLLDQSVKVGTINFPNGIRKGDVATVLGYVARQFNAKVERLVNPGCWGWNYRLIRGSSTSYSNHASGTAIDLNAPKHPLGRSGTFSAAKVAQIRAILKYCEGVVRWGGDYSGRKDEMHFEINVGPGSAALARVAKKIRGGAPAPTPTPTPTSGWPTIKSGSTGNTVKVTQELLNSRGAALVVDGSFGPKAVAAAKAWQKRAGLVADGVLGPKSWVKLVSTVSGGSKGAGARAAQRALNAKGASLVVDGNFGARSVSAAKVFQAKAKLVADGVVGVRTWEALV